MSLTILMVDDDKLLVKKLEETVNWKHLATKIKLRSAHLDNKRYQRHIKSNHSKAAAVETVANEWVK